MSFNLNQRYTVEEFFEFNFSEDRLELHEGYFGSRSIAHPERPWLPNYMTTKNWVFKEYWIVDHSQS